MIKKQQKKGKKIFIWSSIGVITMALILVLGSLPKGNGDLQEEKVQKGDITTYYSFAGNIDAKSKQNITSMKEMHVDKLNVKEGDQVKKGDVLLKNGLGEEIKADIDGEVTKVYVKTNSHVLPGNQLIDIVNFTDLQTQIKVDEYDLKYLKVGNNVDVNINAIDKRVKGTISTISKEATNENGVSYFTATVDLDHDRNIRVGMSAEAKLLKQKAIGVTTLSMDAIKFDSQNKPYVLVASDKGMSTKKYIETGINDGTTVEIKSGLKAGDEVILPSQDNSTVAMMHGGN